jgi:hypothetical protein
MSSDDFDRAALDGKWHAEPGLAGLNVSQRWRLPKLGAQPVTTYTCNVCGFKVTSDTHIRFDEMCEHCRPVPSYTYPWDTYAALIGDEPIPAARGVGYPNKEPEKP